MDDTQLGLLLVGLGLFGGLGWVIFATLKASAGPQVCPNCNGKKTLKKTLEQTLPSINLPGTKEQRLQVVVTYRCSNCYYTFSQNRLQFGSSNTHSSP